MTAIEPFDPPEIDPEPTGDPGDRWLRLLAWCVDSLLPVGAGFAASAAVAMAAVIGDRLRSGLLDASPTWVLGAGAAAFLTVTIVQWRMLAEDGQTLGKRWTGLRIVRADGEPVDFLHAVVLRSWVLNVTGQLIPGLALLDALLIFTPSRRCGHDRLAGTRVVRAGQDPHYAGDPTG